MKKPILRIICALLALSILLGTTSCETATSEKKYDKSIKFEIEKQSIAYTDEFIDNANVQFTNIALNILEVYNGTKLTDAQIRDVSAHFKKTIVPIFLKARIFEDEFNNILDGLEELTAEGSDSHGISVMFDIYNTLICSIDSKRAGFVLYELTKTLTDARRQKATDRYNQYGYSWYLEDEERLSELYNEICDMGAEKFSAICAFTSIIASTMLYTPTFNSDSVFTLGDVDILYILEYHGEYFKELNITEKDATTFGELITEFIPNNASTPLSSHLYSLGEDGYFVEASKVLPSFIKLYSALTSKLRQMDELKIITNPDQSALAIVRALNECKPELSDLLDSIDEHACTSSDRELVSIKQSGLYDEFLTFANNTAPMDNEAFLASLTQMAEEQPNEIQEQLIDNLISRIYYSAPYLTFTLTR